MSLGTTPDQATERRTDRKTCAACEASAAGCRSNEWLRGRRCCERCTGNHDQTITEGASTSPANGSHVDSTGRSDGRERTSLSAPRPTSAQPPDRRRTDTRPGRAATTSHEEGPTS